MIQKEDKRYTLTCDECGDAEYGFKSFSDAKDFKRLAGWQSKMIDGEWVELCPMCNNDEVDLI